MDIVETYGAAHAIELYEVPKGVETTFEVTSVHDVILFFGIIEKVFVIVDCLGTKTLKLLGHRLGFFPEIHHGSVLEKISPLGIESFQAYVVFEFSAVPLEQRTKHMRERENRWAEIKAEALFFEHIELAADTIVFLEDLNIEALKGETRRRGKPAEAGADHDDFFVG